MHVICMFYNVLNTIGFRANFRDDGERRSFEEVIYEQKTEQKGVNYMRVHGRRNSKCQGK